MRVLVVDDDADQVIVRCMLLGHHGFETRRAGDPEAAIRAVGEFRPEIVLMDLGLPAERDGLRLIKELKSSHPEVSVIVLTGSNIQKLRRVPELTGLADLVEKGGSCRALLSSVQRIADLRVAASPGSINIQH